jgi:hypothetical protein
MATQSKNTPTIASLKRRGVILAHASGWCADRPTTPTRSVSEGRHSTPTRNVSEASHSTPTRSVSEEPASPIDWRMVGVAAVMAGLFVVGSVVTAWAANRPMRSIKANTASLSQSPEGAGLPAVAGGLDNKATSSPTALSSRADLIDNPSASSDKPQPTAIYPEGDTRVLSPEAAPSSAAERKNPPEPDCETAPTVAFARDPMQAARVAREDHKLMLVLHISGNFEESKFT